MGQTLIGSLRADLSANTADFDSNLTRSQGKLQAFSRTAQTEGANIGAALDKVFDSSRVKLFDDGTARISVFGSALEALGPLGVAAGAAIGGLAVAFESGKKALEFASAIGDVAAKAAVSTDTLQQYRYAVTQLGGTAQDADAALIGFAKAFGDAQVGLSKKAANPFLALGLDPKSFKDTEDALQAVIVKISNLASTAQQSAIADKLGLTSMLPAIRAGADAINGLRDAAQDLGVVMDADTIEKADEAKKKMTELGQVTMVQLNTALVDLAPLLVSIAGGFADAAKEARVLLGVLMDIENATKDSHFLDPLNKLAGPSRQLSSHGGLVPGGVFGARFQTEQEKGLGAVLEGQSFSAPTASDEAVAQLRAQLNILMSGSSKSVGPPTGKGTVRNFAQEAADAAAAKAAAEAAKKALEQQAASLQAIDAATKGELDARKALATDVETLLGLQEAEVAAETKKANDKLTTDAAQGKITQASAKIAIALNDRSEAEKDAVLEANAEVAIIQDNIAKRNVIGSYYDRIASLAASLATTVSAQNDIEDKALTDRQAQERKNLLDQQQIDRTNAHGDPSTLSKLASSQPTERAAQALQQQLELQVQARTDAVRLDGEFNAASQGSVQAQIDLLTSQQGLTQSSYASAKLAQQILPLQQQLEQLKLEEIIFSQNSTLAQKANAIALLNTTVAAQANATAVAKNNASFLNGLDEAAGALGSMAEAIKSHDFGGLLTGFSGVLKSASGLAGDGKSGISGILGTLGKTLGPIGGIVTGVVSILGSLFGGDSTVGVAHLAAADQQKIQGTGTVLSSLTAQSASIANSLATAAKYQDTDLEFASQQVNYLKAISDGIGRLTASLGNQIGGIAGAFDTSKLGLGTTGTKGLLGLIGASSTTTSLVDQGIDLGSGSLSQYLSGAVSAAFYTDLQSVKTSSGFLGIGGGTKTTNSEQTTAADADVSKTIASVLDSLRGGVLQAAGQIGIQGAQAVLDSVQLDIGRISLDGLSASQITDQLNAVFSKEGDTLAADVAPQFAALQQAGEGMLETLERLATEYTTVDTALASIGTSFATVGADSVVARDNLVKAAGGLDTFTSQISFFQQNFLTDAQAIAPVQAAVAAAFAGLSDQLAALGDTVPTTKAQFVALVDSIDVSTSAGAALFAALMQIAPAFAKVTDYTDTLVSTANDNVTAARSALNNSYQAEISSITTLQQTFQGFFDSLSAYAKTLDTQADGTVANYQQLGVAFDRLAAKAQLGDQTALGGLQDAGTAFLTASAAAASSELDQARDIAKVKAAVTAAADTALRQVNVAQAQLDGINSTVAALGLVNDSVLSVADATAQLAAALQAQFAASGDNSSLGASPEVNALLKSATGYAGAFGAGGFEAYITSSAATDAERAAARAILTSAGQTNRIVGFATGGAGIVGGSGAVDSQIISMRATPGELVSVTHGDPQAATAAALDAMNKQFDGLSKRLDMVIINGQNLYSAATKTGFYARGQEPGSPVPVAA